MQDDTDFICSKYVMHLELTQTETDEFHLFLLIMSF